MPEQHNIEWKSTWKDEYLKWICGFANAHGGRIYIGMDDRGNVVGLPGYQKLLEDILHKVQAAVTCLVEAWGRGICVQAGKRECVQLEILSFWKAHCSLTEIEAKPRGRWLAFLRNSYIKQVL